MSEQQIEEKTASAEECKTQEQPNTEKKAYQKPELRKYSQIDYVTAYGVD